MSHARDIKKPPPEALYLVWVEGPEGTDGSYRIHWSLAHATKWWEKAQFEGKRSRIMQYDFKNDLAKQTPNSTELK